MPKKAQSIAPSLVIVESPAKAKTINKYLGSGFVVKACVGHIRDLPDKELGVDIENNFAPTYHTSPDKRKIIKSLSTAASAADTVYLATDRDREGEAIAWHLVEALKLDPARTRRVVFNEITKSAIQNAFAHPHDLDMNRVNAQQARRVLDRITGYQLSPLLWNKIAKGLSAGRVQSVTVRLIVEREQEIRAFVPEESWIIRGIFATELAKTETLAEEWEAFLETSPNADAGRTQKERTVWLSARACLQTELVKWRGERFRAKTADQAREVAEALGFVCEEVEERIWEEYADKGIKTVDLNGMTVFSKAPKFCVSDISTRRTSTRPSAPFTTATLQQAASSVLRLGVARTMRVAQALYQGVGIEGEDGPVALITYMRTDSTNLSKEAVAGAREFIDKEYGPKYLPGKPNVYGKESKRTQEAHEAIRPTDVTRRPEGLKGKLSPEQYKLYDLIWRRFVTCQMSPAEWDSTTLLISADTAAGEAVFKTSGRRLVFDGFLRVSAAKASDDLVLPELHKKQEVGAMQVDPQQQFTSPTPRYTEASLVQAMKGDGIGRPSTYASIIQNIQDRGYVEQIDRRLYATDKGIIVTEKLVKHFPKILDVKFTSHMEEELDKIEEASLEWTDVLREFYKPFKESLDRAFAQMEPARSEPSEFTCPDCEREMVYRWAKTGRFLSCTGYPECKGSYNVDRNGQPIIPTKVNVKCEVCGREMILRQSRHGPFLGCGGYPECNNTIPCDKSGNPLELVSEQKLERPCDECGEGTMRVKRSGPRSFMGCDRYPTCKHTSPLPEGVRVEKKVEPVREAGLTCELCGSPMHIKKGRRGEFIACSGFPGCRNTFPVDKLDELRKVAAAGGSTLEAMGKDATKKKSSPRRVAKKKVAKRIIPKTPDGKVDIEALGPPPDGFAWTRTGKPVVEMLPEDTLHCPECGSEMLMKRGRFGPFFSCTGFPQCRCTVNLRGQAKKQAEEEMPAPKKPKPIPTEIECEECGAKMLIRAGRSGQFLGCGNFPKCKATKPLPEGMVIPAEGN
ncbi:MAG: type I DNA topoisomerase [Phycisphaerae bacterium]|nr:type I DNA topoisomerase [Phycisphaerae bacterium]